MKIQDYTPNINRKTYYISPANSLGEMGLNWKFISSVKLKKNK